MNVCNYNYEDRDDTDKIQKVSATENVFLIPSVILLSGRAWSSMFTTLSTSF